MAVAEAVVLGAGSAGLGVAAELERRGVSPLVLERAGAVGASWRQRYGDLRLNTDRWVSRLPGSRIPRSAGRWPARDDFVAYLEAYAESRDLAISVGVEASRVERHRDGWEVHTSRGTVLARNVVVCTGHDRVAQIPAWPGMESFEGLLLHASDFDSADAFAGKDVVVVGLGTSATEIATRLADRAGRLRVAIRSAPNLMPAEFLGVPITVFARLFEGAPSWLTDRLGRLVQRLTIGDPSAYGLSRAPYGVASELKAKGMGPVVDRGFLPAVRAGAIELVAAVEGFESGAVCLSDGSRLRPDVLIAATGYRSGLEPLVGHLGVLAPSGQPLGHCLSGKPAAPGLFFNGYWLPLSGELPAMRRTSRRIARLIAA